MGVNKVEFGGETLVDLTGDTVTPQSLLNGYSAHNRAGELIEGLAVVPSKVSELENDSGYIKESEFNNLTPEFNQAEKRENIETKERISIIFGKIKKWLSDLKPVAFSGKYSDLTEKATAQDVGALPVSGGTLESNAEPQLSLKRKSQNFSALLNFENESRKLIQTKGGLESNDPAREAYFSLYDLDADKNGEGRFLELLHLSQNLRNIYDSTTNTMKKILVEGEALPATGGTIQANASPLLILKRIGQYASMDFENNFGKLIRVGVTKGSEAAKPEFHVADVENGADNAYYLFIIKKEGARINSDTRHSLVLNSSNADKTSSVDICMRISGKEVNQICATNNSEIFFWDSTNQHSLFAVSESKRQIYDYKTNSLQEIATLNDLEKRIEKLEAENEFLRGTVKNLAATEEGYALDATMGRVLDEKINEINGKLDNKTYAKKVLTGKWSASQSAPAFSVGSVDILPENIISITGIVNNDSAFLYAYAYENYIGLGIRYIGSGAITNRNYRVIIQYKV